jgi:two-component system response regulator AtoC
VERTVVVVDDQSSILESMEVYFGLRGWQVHTAASGRRGLELARKLKPALVVLDIRLPDQSGLEVLAELGDLQPDTQVIMITAHQDMEGTIQAIKLGAFDYLHKPIDIEEMDGALQRLEKTRAARSAEEGHPPQDADGESESYMTGKSRAMKEIFKTIALVSDSRATVLIQGESGTGKDLVAQAIHRSSRWSQEPFTVMDCSTFVPTLIESELFGYEKGAFTGADRTRPGRLELTGNGTVFFDEIGELPLPLQSKLLRLLQQGEFVRVGGVTPVQSSARIVAATNRDLRTMVRQGKFREDLYFRLQVVTIHVPPLRDRRSDIPLLANFMLRKISRQTDAPRKSLTAGAVAHLMGYDWPGNVRELENTLTRAALLAKPTVLTEEDVSAALLGFREQSTADPSPTPLRDFEREHVRDALESCRWHKGKACQVLGISRPTLRAKIRKYGLRRDS